MPEAYLTYQTGDYRHLKPMVRTVGGKWQSYVVYPHPGYGRRGVLRCSIQGCPECDEQEAHWYQIYLEERYYANAR